VGRRGHAEDERGALKLAEQLVQYTTISGRH
jgi:hypothetical protein